MPKVYNVSVYLDINTVSCPGVWLCPKGKAFLKICLFGVSDLTKEVDPFFPLVFKERFHFQKVFKNMNSVYELHDKLARSIISLELLQCPIGSAGCVKLALFNALLSDILHPYATCFSKPLHTSGLELLFTACKVFPGILAPKADVSTKVMVTDTADDVSSAMTMHLRSQSVNDDDKRRQQKVCHTKNNTNCKCFKSKYEQSNDVKNHRSVEAMSSDESSDNVSHNVIERRLIEKAEVRPDYDRRETINPRPGRDKISENDAGSRVSRENGAMVIDENNGRETPTTVPKELVSGGRNIGAWREDKGRPGNMSSSRNRHDDTSYERREKHQQQQAIIVRGVPDGSRPLGTGEEQYGPERVTSCERLIKEHDYDVILRTNDKALRRRYFKCLKDQHANEQTTFQVETNHHKRGEASKYDGDFMMTGEPQFESVLQRSSKGKVNRCCTCSSSYDKKNKKIRKTAKGRSSRQKPDSREKLTGLGYANHRQSPTAKSLAIPLEGKYDNASNKNGVRQQLQAGEMPSRPKYYEDQYKGCGQPHRIRSRSDMEVYNSNHVERYDRPTSDHKYSRDMGRLKSHELQAGEMPPRSGYVDEVREYQEPTGNQASRSVGGYKDFKRTNVSETGGLGDRVHNENEHMDHLTRPEHVFGQIPLTRTSLAQHDRQLRSTADDGRNDINIMPSDRANIPPSHRIGDRPPDARQQFTGRAQLDRQIGSLEDGRRGDKNVMPSDRANVFISHRVSDRPVEQGSIDVLPTKPADKSSYTLDHRGKMAQSSSEFSDGHSNGGECKCPLCKDYQRMYNPKIHPCPRSKKTTELSSKGRHSKRSNGPKKLIPSRRSTVTKSYMDFTRKTKASSKYRNECGFAKCDSMDHEYIGNKKNIKKFYTQM